jgi:hypothetical protein
MGLQLRLGARLERAEFAHWSDASRCPNGPALEPGSGRELRTACRRQRMPGLPWRPHRLSGVGTPVYPQCRILLPRTVQQVRATGGGANWFDHLRGKFQLPMNFFYPQSKSFSA